MFWTDDLAERFHKFASSARATLHVIAPFMRAEALTAVLANVSAPDVIVVTTWRTPDVLTGASDVDVYPLCRTRGWFLYVHPQLHAKVLAADAQRAVVTSANVTRSALGLVVPGNVECAVGVDVLSPQDRLWLARVVADARLVDAAYHEAFVRHIDAQRPAVVAPVPAPFDFYLLDERRHLLVRRARRRRLRD